MNKRGLSPLFATIILIAFAVSLGAVIMQIGGNFRPPGPKECEAFLPMQVSEVTLSGEGQNGFIQFSIKNSGGPKIDKIIMNIETDKNGETKTETLIPNEPFVTGVQFSKRISYDYVKYGDVKKIKWSPVLSGNGKETDCSSKGGIETSIFKR